MLYLYNFFHLNLAYSAIEEENRAEVIERCYWPLLKLARQKKVPMGIELSGYTLEVIRDIDDSWVTEFKRLIAEGLCELIGCGYSQMIAPIVPSEVTRHNLRIGNQVYQDILGCSPTVALLNEQAYSAGIISLYQQTGYRAVIMEWNNPSNANAQWDAESRFFPQLAVGSNGEEVSVIWNESVSFQKFQRYAHGELELDELIIYIQQHQCDSTRYLPVYGNDIEIFDYRPGRYMTEAKIQADGEWERIGKYYDALQALPESQFILPSQVLCGMDNEHAAKCLSLQSGSFPIPVKKQKKYNVVRWAVTGRNDLYINTRCWNIYDALSNSDAVTDSDWKELCYLWSSDFRTHITESRWFAYLQRLDSAYKLYIKNAHDQSETDDKPIASGAADHNTALVYHQKGRFLTVEGKRLKVVLNTKRGLALESFTDFQIDDHRLLGTLEHGFFDEISYAADYYTAHIQYEPPGKHKVTDLSPVEPHVLCLSDGTVDVSASINLPCGKLHKRWIIDDNKAELRLSYKFEMSEPVFGALRIGNFTLDPVAFSKKSLHYFTHNGGDTLEYFSFSDESFDHGAPVSSLVSSNQAVGMTEGNFGFTDGQKKICFSFANTQAAMIGLVKHSVISDSHFSRVSFSLQEVDDNAKPHELSCTEIEFTITAELET